MMKTVMKAVCLVLIAASIGILFLPVWTVKEETISTAQYLFRPSQYRSLTTELRDTMNTKKLVNRIALPIFLLIAGSAAFLAAGVFRFKKRYPEIGCLCIGAAGVLVCLLDPLLRTSGLWSWSMAAYLCMLPVGIWTAFGPGKK